MEIIGFISLIGFIYFLIGAGLALFHSYPSSQPRNETYKKIHAIPDTFVVALWPVYLTILLFTVLKKNLL